MRLSSCYTIANFPSRIFDYFEFTAEIEKIRESNILYLIVSKFADVDLSRMLTGT